MRFSEKKHVALVLSGGGVKAAAFHIGVCLALREKGFQFTGGVVTEAYKKPEVVPPLGIQTYVGSSAGAVISTFLAAGYSVEAIVDAFTRGEGIKAITRRRPLESRLKPITYRDIFSLNVDAGLPHKLFPKIFKKQPVLSGGIEVLLKKGFKVNGIFSTKNIERYLREHVYPVNRFDRLAANLYIVATQLNHSRKVVFGPYQETTKTKEIKYANYARVSEAVAASAALPPFYSPYGIKNDKERMIYFFDGEIRDTLSTHVAAEHGADLVISSYSIQPYHYNSEMGSLHEYGIPAIFNQALYQLVQQKIERHIKHQKDVKAMINAVNGYLKQAEIATEHREKLIEILIQRTQFNPKVDYVYIHPSPHDYNFFFYDHFSLSPKLLEGMVRTGFKSAMSALRPYSI